MFLDERITLLGDEHLAAFVDHLGDELGRQRVLGNLQHGIRAFATLEVLHQVVEGDTGSDDTHALVGAVNVLVERGVEGVILEINLLVQQFAVMFACVGRQQDELLRVFLNVERVLRTLSFAFHAGTGVRQARGETDDHRGAEFLGHLERIVGDVVSFLLVGRLEARDEREFRIVAGILLVLGGVHGGVVGDHHHETAVGAGDGGVHERVSGHVQAHVFHAHHRAFARVGHTDGGLHSGLLVASPDAMHLTSLALLGVLDKFGDFS